MGCRGCEDKPSRYKTTTKVDPETGRPTRTYEPIPATGDVDVSNKPRPAPGFLSEPTAEEAFQAFEQVKAMSYKQLKLGREKKDQFMALQADMTLGEMTSAMKRIHVEQLVSIINHEDVNPMGMVPGAAVSVLKKLLEKEDFLFITDIYPSLKAEIDRRYELIEADKIVLDEQSE